MPFRCVYSRCSCWFFFLLLQKVFAASIPPSPLKRASCSSAIIFLTQYVKSFSDFLFVWFPLHLSLGPRHGMKAAEAKQVRRTQRTKHSKIGPDLCNLFQKPFSAHVWENDANYAVKLWSVHLLLFNELQEFINLSKTYSQKCMLPYTRCCAKDDQWQKVECAVVVVNIQFPKVHTVWVEICMDRRHRIPDIP